MAGTPAQNKEGKIESDERNLFLTLGCLGRMTFEKTTHLFWCIIFEL